MLFFLLLTNLAFANVEVFTEAPKETDINKLNARAKRNEDMIQSDANLAFKKTTLHIEVPGFITTSPIPLLGTIIGPVTSVSSNYRMGDNVYLKWVGSPMPKVGELYQTYGRAIVLQNTQDPTDFEVIAPPDNDTGLPGDRRMAGYFYEQTGTIRIYKISGGGVEAIVEALKGQVTRGEYIMPKLPSYDEIKPIYNGVQLSAAIVSGSPPDRINTIPGAYVYINRGLKDGIRPGTVFEAVETVKLEGAAYMPPEVSLGEAMVVHATESFSTAIISRQFDVIRIGGLLKTKHDYQPTPQKKTLNPVIITAIDADENGKPKRKLKAKPGQKGLGTDADGGQSEKGLSELDALEKQLNAQSLTEKEKARLNKLSKQEKGKLDRESMPATPDGPGVDDKEETTDDNSKKKDSKKADPKKKKKTKNKDDEQDLNLLIQQG